MDLLEATVYLFAIAVLLAVVYIIPYLLTAHLNGSKACGPRWLESTLKKGDARTLLFAPLETLETEECGSKATYSHNWWMDENQFQLERRAIFSKVRHLLYLVCSMLTSRRLGFSLPTPQDFRKLETTAHLRSRDSLSSLSWEKTDSYERSITSVVTVLMQ